MAYHSTKNKYHNEKTTVDGIKFDSKKEANRYLELKMLERAGEISDLQLQVKYELVPPCLKPSGKHTRAVEYIADFVYNENGKTVVEDVKGYKRGSAYNIFRIKQKLMLWVHGIYVEEV